MLNAGILRTHNEAILDELNFTKISLNDNNSLTGKFASLIKVFKHATNLDRRSAVIFHFPVHSSKNKLLLTMLAKKHTTTVAIVVDIDGLRDKNNSLLNNEINLLKNFDYIIAHNDAMKKFLQETLPDKKILTIDIFDYASVTQPAAHPFSTDICFAGNLEKSTFIYRLNDTSVNLYGQGFDVTNNHSPNIHYKGTFDPGILPSKLEGGFGLIWDGSSTELCDEYLRYNNPHKFSLYLAAGLPVITWNESAIAKMVIENNIGVTVNTLVGLNQQLANISPQQYLAMQQNAMILGNKISRGYYLQKLINQIIFK